MPPRFAIAGGTATFAAIIFIAAWLGPGGCESPNASVSRLPRPSSPLESRLAARGGTTGATAPQNEPPPERPFPPSEEPDVRVRIGTLRAGETQTFTSPRGFELRTLDASSQPLRLSSPISIGADLRGWLVRDRAGNGEETHSFDHLRPIELSSIGDAPIGWNGSQWPGRLRVVARTEVGGGAADLVAVVPLETYLPGVLAKELFKNWSRETYRAQAIAARSFAISEAAYWRGRRHFDLVAGEASQAWIGQTRQSNATRAVADTRGQVLVFEDRVVPAYYSSCCGCAAADAVESISKNPWHDIAPLSAGRTAAGARHDCCEQAPTFRWTERLPVADVVKRLNAWGRENGRSDLAKLPSLRSISMTRENAAGRPIMVQLMDDGGATVELPAEDLRYAINATPEGDASKVRLKSSFVTAAVDRGVVTFTGHGHGHGVGMCQYGAETMAKEGRAWNEILARYYPGASISRCY